MPRLFAVQLKDEPAERYEQWVNTPVYTRDYEDCVGWLGCELPEDGHSCEFAELAGDGAVTCASSSKVNRLREENAKLRELTQKVWKWERNGCYECPLEKDCKVLCVYDGDCGIAVEIEKELQELGIEVSHDD